MGRTKSRRKARKPVKRGPLAKARKRVKKPAQAPVNQEVVERAAAALVDRERPLPGKCEVCGVVSEELRPYGRRNRLWVCFGCANKDRAAMDKRMLLSLRDVPQIR